MKFENPGLGGVLCLLVLVLAVVLVAIGHLPVTVGVLLAMLAASRFC